MSLINHINFLSKEKDLEEDPQSEVVNKAVDDIVSDIMDISYVHVEICSRKIFKKKILGIFNTYDKIPVYRLIYITPSAKIKSDNSYEEYNTHGELYKRLVTQPICGKPFPNNIKINEFIDLGFTIIIL